MDAPFPQKVLADADYWARFLAADWVRDFPDAEPGTGWRDDLEAWLADSETSTRRRTIRAMRKLRRTSLRSFDVMYRTMIVGESFEQITAWLNVRALRNGIPLPPGRDVHYTLRDTVALWLAGIELCRSAW